MNKLFVLLGLVLSVNLAAQIDSVPVIDYLEPEELEIGGVQIKGNQFTDDNALINLSGLRVGETIKIPGDETREAVKKLMKLRLFTDVQIFETKRIGKVVFLEIEVKERPRLSGHYYSGVPKGQHDDLNKKTDRILVKGTIVTENMKANACSAVQNFYIEKGFMNAKVTAVEEPDEVLINSVRVGFKIEKGYKVRIGEVVFNGNSQIKTAKLRKKMKKTKAFKWWKFFIASKFDKKEYETDKENLLKYYNSKGYRDSRIISDTVYMMPKGKKPKLKVEIAVNEGQKYYFGDIVFKGNSIYKTDLLRSTLNIEKGDVYNQELLNSRLNFDMNGKDISTIYMDNGYLFFRVTPVETGIRGDTIDMDIRIVEGPQATIDKVIIKGNDRTHEHVIRRELRVRPGQKFSRSDIIRSQREILALNYFNPENLKINTPVNPEKGTVDIEFEVEERPADQLELSAGWGGAGRGVIGTLGVSFNNFSLRNILKPETWSPLPQGDGQRLSLRVQTTGKFYQFYNFSFTEPWLGGKKPNAFSVSLAYSRQTNGRTAESSSFSRLGIVSAQVSLGTRLRWPDDFFVSNSSIGYQNYNLTGGSFGFVYANENNVAQPLPEGIYHGLTFSQTIARNSIMEPVFPKSGSRISLSVSLTPPYSLFNKKDYSGLGASEKFKFLEYHKWNFRAEWYHKIVGNLVVKTAVKMGFLGSYSSRTGTSPFERFQVGGDGINVGNFQQGFEIISTRGYDVTDINPGADTRAGSALFNKFTVELRYPISLAPSSTIWVQAFFEGSNAWNRFRDYDPLDLRRSAGMGLRVFLPMFGTLGFDYGFGFDKNRSPGDKWTALGKFNIILGFEPE